MGGSFHRFLYVYQRAAFISSTSGWWYTYPSEKYDFVSWGYYAFPIYGKS